MLRRLVMIFMVALLALPLPALGQPTPLPDVRAQRIIEALLIWRMVDELNLTEQQIARLFPRIRALKEIRLGLGRRKVELQRELRALLRERPRNEDAIRSKLTELDGLRRETEQRRQRVLGQIRNVLTLEQQARFAFIQERFEAETLRLLQEVQQIIQQTPNRQ